MANINDQTKQVLNQNQNITQTTDKTLGNVQAENVVKEPSSLDVRVQTAIDEGIYSPKLRERLIGDMMLNMFGDPTGGLKYPDGTDEDKTFENNRFDRMSLDQVFDEHQYWNQEAQNVWNLDEDAGMNVKDWFSKMFERLQSKKEPKAKETELLKGSSYIPPQP